MIEPKEGVLERQFDPEPMGGGGDGVVASTEELDRILKSDRLPPDRSGDIGEFVRAASEGQLTWLVERIGIRPEGKAALLRYAERDGSSAGAGIAEKIGHASGLDPELQKLIDASGTLLSANAVAARLHVTRQAVAEAQKARRLLGIRFGNNWRYPAIQLRNTEILPGLSGLLRSLGAIDGWDALRLLLAPDAPAEEQPLVLLHAGDRSGALAALMSRRRDWQERAFPPSEEVDSIRAALDRDLDAEVAE